MTAVFYNGAYAGNDQLYINGVPQALSACGGIVGVSRSATQNFQISSTPSYPTTYAFRGSLANFQIYNTALSAGQVQQLYREGISGDPLATNLVAWYSLNGNSNDYSGNGNNGIMFGNINLASASSIPNANANATSAFIGNFNGQSSYVSANTPQISTAAGGRNTVSFWMYWSGNTNQMPFGFSNYGLYLGSGCLGFSTLSGDVYGTNSLNPANKWVFVTAVFYNGAYTGNSLLYINGVPQALSQCSGGGSSGSATQNFRIASAPSSPAFFSNSIANLQIYNTALTVQQIQQIYQEGIVGMPLTGSLVGWWPLDGNANDYSSYGNNGAATNVIYSPQQVTSPYPLSSLGSYGANFNGQNSYIDAGNGQSLRITGSITLAAWFKTSSQVGSYNTLIGKWWSGGVADGGSYELMWATGNGLTFNLQNSNHQVSSLVANNKYNDGRWHLAVGTWDGSTMALYVDGAKVSSVANGGFGALEDTDRTVRIATDNKYAVGTGDRFFNGSVSDAQIYNTALSASQVQQLYQSQMPPSASAAVPLSWVP